MRRLFTFAAIALCAAGSSAQIANFECYPLGILPNDVSCGSCEGVVANSLVSALNGVSSTPACGFPTSGAQYAVIICNGPAPVPNGGPAIWPVPTNVQEVRIPIPLTATGVSFDWEYFNAEGFGSSFNDGMAVGVVDAAGALITQLVYADNQVALGTCVSGGTEVAPAGPQISSFPLPALTGCEYLSIQCWNEGDNAVSGRGYIDNVVFAGPAATCSPPGFPPPAVPPSIIFSSPFGMGSLQVDLGGLPLGGTYFLPVTLNAGLFPNGWFYGLDIGFDELAGEISFGFPFSGPLTSTACSTGGGAQIGPFGGLPSGLVIYARGLGMPGPTLAPPVTLTTPAASYTIP